MQNYFFFGPALAGLGQGKPRLRWVDNVRKVATSLGVRDWQASARDRGQWRAVVEAAVGLRPCSANRVRERVSLLVLRWYFFRV